MNRNTTTTKSEARKPAKDKGRYQEFICSILSCDVETLGGVGYTLDDAIEHWREAYVVGFFGNYEDYLAKCVAHGETAESFWEWAGVWNDVVIWQNGRVLAVVSPHPDGLRECVVTRFDRSRRPVTDEAPKPAPTGRKAPRSAVPSKATRPKWVGRKPKAGGV